jgi:KaiC/GvpD/RAD55 family RecA-like ATPase
MLQRVPTGIKKFDALIEGGFPKNGIILVAGNSGAGKTQFSATFLYNGAKLFKETGLYVTLEERAEGIKCAMQNIGIDFSELENAGLISFFDVTAFRKQSPDYFVLNFESLRKGLSAIFDTYPIHRLVIDSITPLAIEYPTKGKFRSSFFKFVEYIRDRQITTLLLTEIEEGKQKISRYGIEEYLADGVILLKVEQIGLNYERWITIRKMRYTSHDTKLYRLKVEKSGLKIVESETEKKFKDTFLRKFTS